MAITKYKTDKSPCRTYRALLTQTGTQSSNIFLVLNVGETYTIMDYLDGDDFSNIADVKSGTINQTGCVFVATGKFPNRWGTPEDALVKSELQTSGNLFVIELENSLGFPIEWYHRDPEHEQSSNGNYFAYSPVSGTSSYIPYNLVLTNVFPREKTIVTAQTNYDSCDRVVYGITTGNYDLDGDNTNTFPNGRDSIVFIQAQDSFGGSFGPVDDRLQYVSVTIEIYP